MVPARPNGVGEKRCLSLSMFICLSDDIAVPPS